MGNKQKLIDVNKFISILQNMVQHLREFGWNEKAELVESVIKWLRLQPTVDAVEVVHGEWVVCGDGEYVPFMCSACGKTTSWYHAQTANFCPNCGATMDGGK